MELYVDIANGRDYNSGARWTDSAGIGPVQTIACALHKVETARETGDESPVTVWLLPGVYPLTDSVRIPSTCRNVTFRALHGGVQIIGAKKLDFLRADTLYGTRCLSAELPDGAIPEDLFANGT